MKVIDWLIGFIVAVCVYLVITDRVRGVVILMIFEVVGFVYFTIFAKKRGF